MIFRREEGDAGAKQEEALALSYTPYGVPVVLVVVVLGVDIRRIEV